MEEDQQHENAEWTYQTEMNENPNVLLYLFDLSFFSQKTGEEEIASPSLTIESMDRHKGGSYICTADNGVGPPATSPVVLHVLCECSIPGIC